MAGKELLTTLLLLAAVQGITLAQFNILPVFAAEKVISEHKQEHIEQEKTEQAQKVNAAEESSAAVVPVHPKIQAGLTSAEKPEIKREKRQEPEFTRKQVNTVQRSAKRTSDIDSFLSELESDISKTQHTRFNANPVNQAPSWSYKSAPTTQRSFWKKFGDSIGSTYTQVKTKAKDIAKGLKI